MPTAYAVDLAFSDRIIPYDKLEVTEYDQEDLADELEEWGVSDPRDLSDPDRRVFTNEQEAESFLKQYKSVLRSLPDACRGKMQGLPNLGYRTRYLVLALMGLKLTTSRTYRKPWGVGQFFNLHDRRHYLTVQLTGIRQEGEVYHYDFKIPS
jgi:hypothetical protein